MKKFFSETTIGSILAPAINKIDELRKHAERKQLEAADCCAAIEALESQRIQAAAESTKATRIANALAKVLDHA